MGRYEQLNEQPVAAESDVRFVCFTDNPDLTSETWELRVVTPRFPMDSIRSARYIKIMGPTLLDGYEETLWIDNSVRLKSSPESILDEWLATSNIAIPLHSSRTSVLGEFDAVATSGYDDPARVYEQLIQYSTLRPTVVQERPYWTALLARRSDPAVAATMQLWYEHVLRYSRRDQLSINFAVAELALAVNGIDVDNENSQWHEWPIREARKWHVAQDRMAAALRPPTVEIGRLQNELAATEATLVKVAAENDALRIQAIDVVNVRNEFANSTSWRLTAPIRALSRLGRRSR